MEFAADLVPWLQMGLIAAFAGLALVALLQASRAGSAGWWAAAMFGALALALAGVWLPEELGMELPDWLSAVWICFLLAFPYLLLRFTASFRPLPLWLEVLTGLAAAGALAVTAVEAFIPESAQEGDPLWDAYLPVMLAYWVLVALVSVVRLWLAGRGQPTVARRRMRLMSVATTVLSAAVILEVVTDNTPALFSLCVLLAALLSAAAFGLGFHPPRGLRLSWRQPEEAYVQTATLQVLRSTTHEEVAQALLPPTVRIVGGAGAALVDEQSRVVASHADAPAVGAHLRPAQDQRHGATTREAVPLGYRRGQLVVWTSRYTPFFGREEVGLLRNMAAIAALALERCDLLEEERARRSVVEQAQREAEEAKEEANRANTAKSEFLSRMSHELRTPLNAILGVGQLLEISELNDDDREAVAHILKAGRHLLALINDVLDLSRIEAGMMTTSLEPVHTGELVQDAVALIQPLADRRSIQLHVERSGCDVYVTTDRQRCRQVLLNLLSNAVKYNHDRGQVDVHCRRISEDLVRVAVRDSGPGIDPARRERLFEPFDRLGAESSGVEGTGLGLALSKQLIERLGGAIGVDSGLGRGTTFWIDLPVTDRPDDAEEPVAGPQPGARAATPRTLLLVEDNLANLRVVEAMLRQRPGVSVLPAMQGKLATELAWTHHPDVIVLDLHLPDVPGREVLNRLQADPRTRHIPVIIATADATPGRVRQLREQGAFDYITKPLDLSRFLTVIDGAMEHHDRSHPGATGDGGPRHQLDAPAGG